MDERLERLRDFGRSISERTDAFAAKTLDEIPPFVRQIMTPAEMRGYKAGLTIGYSSGVVDVLELLLGEKGVLLKRD